MSKIDDIINLVYAKTNGFIKLSPDVAQAIIALFAAYKDDPGPHAKLYQYRPVSNQYEFIRIINVTQEQIDQVIKEALDKGPINNFYLYELYNASGDSEGKIFSSSPNLFALFNLFKK